MFLASASPKTPPLNAKREKGYNFATEEAYEYSDGDYDLRSLSPSSTDTASDSEDSSTTEFVVTSRKCFLDNLSESKRKLCLKERIRNYCLNPTPQRFDKPSLPAFVFDIDGVFKNGGKYADFGAKAIRKLQKANIPYVFMTNGGGGRTEAQYADVMNKKLAEFDSEMLGDAKYVSEQQMILSYTPFATHLDHLKNDPVMIVGCPRAINAAKSYGFTKAMSLSDYTRKHSTMNPFGKAGCEKDSKVIKNEKETWNEKIKAILVFTDPSDFFEALQVLTDLLLSSRPGEKEYERHHRIPIVFSNPDLLWKTQYAHARFGQGAFRLSLEACYKARMQAMGLDEDEIQQRLGDFVQFGKPENSQFFHAREAAIKRAESNGCSISHFYMIGDNPRSDITGAVRMQGVAEAKKLSHWSGMLVRTGVWQDGDKTMGAKGIFDDVVEVIDEVLKKHRRELLSFQKS